MISAFKTSRHRVFKPFPAALLLLGILSAVLTYLVNRYAVNVLALDLWSEYYELSHRGYLACFFMQYSFHHVGVGGLLQKILIEMSGWNVRWESFASIPFIVGSAACGLGIAYRLRGRLVWWDLLIPLAFVHLNALGLVFPNPFLGYNTVALFLVMVYVLNEAAPETRRRCLIRSTLLPLILFSGPAFLILPGACLSVLWTYYRRRQAQDPHSERELLSVLPLALFIPVIVLTHNYQWGASIDRVRPTLVDMIRFAAILNGSFAGLGVSGPVTTLPSEIAGYVITALEGIVVGMELRAIVRKESDPLHGRVVLILIGYSLTWVAIAAAIRSDARLQAALQWRYLMMFVPGYLGVYLSMTRVFSRDIRLALNAQALLVLLATNLFTAYQVETLSERQILMGWRDCYLLTHDKHTCDEKFPELRRWLLHDDTVFQKLLDNMEKRHLNFFRTETRAQSETARNQPS